MKLLPSCSSAAAVDIGQLAEYIAVNDAGRLSYDLAMRCILGGRAAEGWAVFHTAFCQGHRPRPLWPFRWPR